MLRGGSRYGAGRPGWHGKVEQCLRLDVRAMERLDLLRAGYLGAWEWTNGVTDEQTASSGYSVEQGAMTLRYSIGGDARNQHVRLERTRCHFGGLRSWFICPIRGERVALL